MDYQVDLDTFRGPLDLLLYLVKRDEIDILDIPIAQLADQFLHHIREIELLDVELVGDFLVMAATLMEIKSRMLLPRGVVEGEEEADPRQELVRQLIEYKKFKDAAGVLEARAEQQMFRLPRVPVAVDQPNPADQPLRAVELWDLVSAFGRLMRETLATAPQAITVDETPIHVYMESIVNLLRATPRMPFAAVFVPPHTRGRLLGLFLAVLELIKGRQIHVDQNLPFGEIWVSLGPENEHTEPSPEH